MLPKRRRRGTETNKMTPIGGSAMLDCLILMPFEPATATLLDRHMRPTYLAHVALPLERATVELEANLGVRLNYWEEQARPTIAGQELEFPRTRTLGAVVLASALEHAGLAWHAIDPGVRELDWWRRELAPLRSLAPRTVALSTTFTMHLPWITALIRVIRRAFPAARLVVGGSYYASNAENFLSLDADILCVGEGEVRLPQIVRAVRDGTPLDGIPGLYLAGPDGGLRHTGHVEFLNMRERPPVDWRLAGRIAPAMDITRDLVEVGVETQRGCVFKCEFCSYRTLTAPNALAPEAAAEAILQAGVIGNAAVNIIDSTATFPHERWAAVLRALIARGGAPHRFWCFARVNDINEESAALMRAAGQKHVFVGQESGDQRILDLMRKGTGVEHVRIAVEALARHDLSATFSFIHGFPGETDESIRNTRRMIETLNDGHVARPPVLTYLIYPFSVPDLASVAMRAEFQDRPHFLDYAGGSDHAQARIFAAVLETIMAVSRIPHAPAYSHLLLKSVMPTTGSSVFSRLEPIAVFRYLKAVERGVAIFLERELEGRKIDAGELRRVRETILSHYPGRRLRTGMARRHLLRPALRVLGAEWRAEPARGPGLLTRAVTAAMIAHQTRDAALALHTWRTADCSAPRPAEPTAARGVATHAATLVAHARTTGNKYLKEALPRRAR
jgi:hypothetical protein